MTAAEPLLRLPAQRLGELKRASEALELSYRRVGSADMIDVLSRSADGLVEIEAFTARFARMTDLLIQQVMRTVDEIELEPAGSVLDRIARAEKRGWVASAEQLTQARILRNRIAHDYDAEGWRLIARAAHALTPVLLLAAERAASGAAALLTDADLSAAR
jgi:hypothetical protein